MNHNNRRTSKQSARHLPQIACTAVLTAIMLPLAHAHHRVQPVSPDSPLYVSPAEGRLFRIGYAIGTQQYVCKSSVDSLSGLTIYEWTLFGPQATLFKDEGLTRQNMTHFQSSNPLETDPSGLSVGGTPRPTWQDSKDTSAVWAQPPIPRAQVAATCTINGVTSPAIALLKLGVDADPLGPTGKLTETTYIQRLSTCGGVMPSTGCTEAGHAGMKALVPYTADYLFYTAPESNEDGGEFE
ncbi:MAG: DUF3455 domain-containing protein [Chromatiales bacterium]